MKNNFRAIDWMVKIARKWPSGFMFACHTCRFLFAKIKKNKCIFEVEFAFPIIRQWQSIEPPLCMWLLEALNRPS
jgi:hypothetical protein